MVFSSVTLYRTKSMGSELRYQRKKSVPDLIVVVAVFSVQVIKVALGNCFGF